MLTLALVALLCADPPPRYAGGAKPTPLDAPAEVTDTPSSWACTVDTLKRAETCLFDGRAPRSTDVAAQAQANAGFAARLGATLCQEHGATLVVEAAERQARVRACAARIGKLAPTCTLEGRVSLVDGDGRFLAEARPCYLALAEALQRMDPPPAPPKPAEKR